MWNIHEWNKNWKKLNQRKKIQLANPRKWIVVEDEINIKKLHSKKLMNQKKKWKGTTKMHYVGLFLCEW